MLSKFRQGVPVHLHTSKYNGSLTAFSGCCKIVLLFQVFFSTMGFRVFGACFEWPIVLLWDKWFSSYKSVAINLIICNNLSTCTYRLSQISFWKLFFTMRSYGSGAYFKWTIVMLGNLQLFSLRSSLQAWLFATLPLCVLSVICKNHDKSNKDDQTLKSVVVP